MVMKIKNFILLCICIVIASINLYSQYLPGADNDNSYVPNNDTLLKHKRIIGLNLKAVNCLDAVGVDLGLKVGEMFTEKFSTSFSIYYLFTQSLKFNLNDSNQKGILQLAYLGVESEYYVPIIRPLMLSLSGFLGLGTIQFSQSASIESSSNTSNDWIILFEPSININYAISNNTIIGLGASYRLTSGVNFYKLRNNDLNCFVIPISFKYYF
jgi:hypothetical protein